MTTNWIRRRRLVHPSQGGKWARETFPCYPNAAQYDEAGVGATHVLESLPLHDTLSPASGRAQRRREGSVGPKTHRHCYASRFRKHRLLRFTYLAAKGAESKMGQALVVTFQGRNRRTGTPRRTEDRTMRLPDAYCRSAREPSETHCMIDDAGRVLCSKLNHAATSQCHRHSLRDLTKGKKMTQEGFLHRVLYCPGNSRGRSRVLQTSNTLNKFYVSRMGYPRAAGPSPSFPIGILLRS